jgi:hypothetical protein
MMMGAGNNSACMFSKGVFPHRKTCQHADWPAHKPVCKNIQATKARLQVSAIVGSKSADQAGEGQHEASHQHQASATKWVMHNEDNTTYHHYHHHRQKAQPRSVSSLMTGSSTGRC